MLKGMALFVLAGVPFMASADTGPAAPTAPAADQQANWEARIVRETGDVLVQPAGQKDFFRAQVDTPLESGDAIQTGPDADCDVTLDGASLLHIDKGTHLALASLDRKQTRFELSVGGLLGKLAGTSGHPADMEFHTPTAWGGLRGTEIGIETTGTESHFGVFDEGELAVRNARGGEVLLTPRMELATRPNEALGAPTELRLLEKRRDVIERIRLDRLKIAAQWRPLPKGQRQELRRQLRAQKPMPARAVERQLRRLEKRRQKEFDRTRRDVERRAPPTQPQPRRPEPRRYVPRVPSHHR